MNMGSANNIIAYIKTHLCVHINIWHNYVKFCPFVLNFKYSRWIICPSWLFLCIYCWTYAHQHMYHAHELPDRTGMYTRWVVLRKTMSVEISLPTKSEKMTMANIQICYAFFELVIARCVCLLRSENDATNGSIATEITQTCQIQYYVHVDSNCFAKQNVFYILKLTCLLWLLHNMN
jgi:hypothetical protein